MNQDQYALAIEAELQRAGLLPDACQMAVIAHLGQILAGIDQETSIKFSWWSKKGKAHKGIFLWGGVGRGKTVLLNAMASVMPLGTVARYHQHVFLDAFHGAVSMDFGVEDRFQKAVLSLLGSARLLVLDEFHAYDLADAQIIERALRVISAQGVCLALTANHCPWALWPKTAFHARQARYFDPLVDLLRHQCDFIELDHGLDYRERASQNSVARWLVPDLPENRGLALSLIKDSRFPYSEASFEFADLCGGWFRHADYKMLTRRLPFLVLNGLPRAGPADGDALRRLVWLIDAAWEAGLAMTVVSNVELDSVFDGIGSALALLMGNDLERTQSRLRGLVCIEKRRLP